MIAPMLKLRKEKVNIGHKLAKIVLNGLQYSKGGPIHSLLDRRIVENYSGALASQLEGHNLEVGLSSCL